MQQKNKKTKIIWPQNVIEVMKYLFDHHGSDFLTITRELRELFPKEKFFSDKIKRYTDRYFQKKVYRIHLTSDEIIFVHKLAKAYVINDDQPKQLWSLIYPYFPQISKCNVRGAYDMALKTSFKMLCDIYLTDQILQRKFYFYRLTRLRSLTWLAVMFLAQQPQNLKQLQFIKLLMTASIKLESWVTSLIVNKICNLPETSKFSLLQREFQKLPKIPVNEMIEVFEIILTFDTLVRICHSNPPYDFPQQYEEDETSGEDTQNNGERLDVQTSGIKKIFYPEDATPMNSTRVAAAYDFVNEDENKRNYVALSQKHFKLILNSEMMIYFIPFFLKLGQQSQNEPVSHIYCAS